MSLISPSLFIGIGTNGWQMLDDLRKLMYEEFGKAGLPCFRYIALESNMSHQGDNSFIPHPPSEYEQVISIQIPVPNTNVIINSRLNPQSNEYVPGLVEWLDESLIDRGQHSYEAGAGSIRQAGRLCLWENWSTVSNRIRESIESIRSLDIITATDNFLRNEYLPRKNLIRAGLQIAQNESLVGVNPKVYIVGTLCGGTCSGAFIDIAYFVRQVLGIQNQNAQMQRNLGQSEVVGLFTIIDTLRMANENNLQQAKNCWAALRELDFYYQPQTIYRVTFPDGIHIETMSAPFDWVYLESMSNGLVNFVGDHFMDLTRMCALNLFTEVVGGSSAKKAESRVDFKAAAAGFMEPNDKGHLRALSSFGLSAFWYPRYRIAKGISRELGIRMANDWLGEVGRTGNAEQEAQADWNKIIEDVKGNLLGTTANALCNTNLHQEIENIFSRYEATFRDIDMGGGEDFIRNFPDSNRTFADLLASPNGEYYMRIANAGTLVVRKAKDAMQSCINQFLRNHSFVEIEAYLNRMERLSNEFLQELPDEIPVFTPQINFSLEADVYGDLWTRLLGKRKAAIAEYRIAIWLAFKKRVLDQLNMTRDYFLKQVITQLKAELSSLKVNVSTAKNNLQTLKDTCAREKNELINFENAPNIVAISYGAPGIDDDIDTGVAAILTNNELSALRILFIGDEKPLSLLNNKTVIELVAILETKFDQYAQSVVCNFSIGNEVLDNHRQRIRNMVCSSFHYVQTVPGWSPMITGRSPHFIFCSNLEEGNRLAELTGNELQDRNFAVAGWPLEHFILFYREAPGLAISDLQIAEYCEELLDKAESSSAKIASYFTHKDGKWMFDLSLRKRSEELECHIRRMQSLIPEVFRHTDSGEVYLEIRPHGIIERIYVSNVENVRKCIINNYDTLLIDIFRNKLQSLGEDEVKNRINRILEQITAQEEFEKEKREFEKSIKRLFLHNHDSDILRQNDG